VGYAASPAFGDVDGDGDLDAFVGESLGSVVFFENRSLDAPDCNDGVDNDGDGFSDEADPGCSAIDDTSEQSDVACDNGLDDDGDEKIDWRGDASGDPNCTDLTDPSEAPPPPPAPSAAPACGLGPELGLALPLLAALRGRRRGG
jgi:hypothetical protein